MKVNFAKGLRENKTKHLFFSFPPLKQSDHYCAFQTVSFIKIGPIPSLALMVSSELLISQRPLFFFYELLMRGETFKAVEEKQ